ncbi:MAG: hypothetical protein GTO51_04245 [Candidatus Latescibacteria bacterium]|nr:hypothetical protein [Candidatus Latescibacterota bacterium]NIM21051.1 hypothetical protein [Candidatus Latescibacterota bacterium]NIM65186.1 hypothetical protein [Candidatus Latescibacterota bacterium]NIO01701.1 hypothetical protein [Candidatus Latescibacterota bacterium]NIO28218.1 hypothetical protein [Candidatus Latescibacterota bacterium]
MDLLKKKWLPEHADTWTKEDTITIIISPIIYILLTIGCALSVLLIPLGFLLLFVGIVLLIVMVRLINPKLSAISENYEKKQKQYLEDLEKKVKWED